MPNVFRTIPLPVGANLYGAPVDVSTMDEDKTIVAAGPFPPNTSVIIEGTPDVANPPVGPWNPVSVPGGEGNTIKTACAFTVKGSFAWLRMKRYGGTGFTVKVGAWEREACIPIQPGVGLPFYDICEDTEKSKSAMGSEIAPFDTEEIMYEWAQPTLLPPLPFTQFNPFGRFLAMTDGATDDATIRVRAGVAAPGTLAPVIVAEINGFNSGGVFGNLLVPNIAPIAGAAPGVVQVTGYFPGRMRQARVYLRGLTTRMAAF